MKQLTFDFYEVVPRDVKSLSNQTSRNDAKLQKKQKQEQKALETAKRFQARLRKR